MLIDVAGYKGVPMLGDNYEITVEDLEGAIKKQNITWRFFCDGGTDGPISTRWNVRMWPTTYVLDAQGVIRYRNTRDETMDDAIEALLRGLRPRSPK